MKTMSPPLPAVGAIGTAQRHELFAAEADHTVAPIAALYINLRLVVEHGHNKPSVRAASGCNVVFVFEEHAQRGKPRVDLVKDTVARPFVEVLPALDANALAAGAAVYLHRDFQQAQLAEEGCQIDKAVVADAQFAGRRCRRRIVEEIVELDRNRQVYDRQAARAFCFDTLLSLPDK
jgi:hypothetical protein